MHKTTVNAPANAGIASILTIKAELAEALKNAKAADVVVFDISGAEQVDSSLGQLIFSFEAEARKLGLETVIKGAENQRSVSALLSCSSCVRYCEDET